MSKKIIIIGNGAAGNAALEEILKSQESHHVTVISSEPTPAYYRPMLSEYLSEAKLPKRFYLHELSWYSDNHVDFINGKTVTEIHPDTNQVSIGTQKLHYDVLILATGSNNFIPPMPGADLENVISLRTLEDAETIKQMAMKAKKTAIIGGGLLGLELGWQLIKAGLSVDVIEMMDRLLPRQLDPEASEIFEQKVEAAGIHVIKGVQTKAVLGDTKAESVELGNGATIEADFVAFSIGVRADIKLAKAAGIKTDRGICVDDHMRTNYENIFAAGDCAEFKGINYAIWPEATDQGKIAGLNAIGKRAVYDPIVPFNIYSGMNMRLFSIGDVGGNPGLNYETHKNQDDTHFEKYYFVDDVIVGGILLDDISKSAKLKKALLSKTHKSEFLSSL